MADALGKLSFPIQAFGQAHVIGILPEFGQDGLHLGILHAAGLVGGSGLFKLAGAEFHVVEIGDGLAQLVGDIGQHGFEAAESLTGIAGILRIHGIVGEGVADEHGHAPVGGPVKEPGLVLPFQGQETEHLAVQVGLAGGSQLGADVARYRHDVPLQHVHVRENGMVDTLQHIIRRITGRFHLEGVVNETATQRTDCIYGCFQGELAQHRHQVFFHFL